MEAASVTWSPDGGRLAVVARRVRTGPLDVYSVDTNGGQPAQITTNLDVLGAGWNR